MAVLLLLFLGVAGVIYSQEDFLFLGRYDDVRQVSLNNTKNTNQFVFTRLVYNGRIPGYYKNWYTDFPRADRHLIDVLKRLTNIDIADGERIVAVNDPDLLKYPMIYSSEVEQMVITNEEALILRNYLTRGGFWIIDDNWGSFEWALIEDLLHRIFPDREIKSIPQDHPIFHVFYDVNRLIQTPSSAYFFNGGITWETDGFEPECKAIFDDHGRIMVVINHNTDLGDSYEWSDDARYPSQFSVYGYHMAVNFIMYAMTH